MDVTNKNPDDIPTTTDPKETIDKRTVDSYQAQVESFLLAQIESDAWPLGVKIPSERELSVQLDVSRTTVRNAVLALTSKGLFDRRIGQGTFVRRKPGRAKAVRETVKGTLGYVVCKEKSARQPIALEAFYSDVFSGIEEETARSGRHTLFTYLDDYDADEVEAFDAFIGKVDGVVIEEARNQSFLERVIDHGVPVVLLAPTVTCDRLDLVTMDLAGGAKKAVLYLRGLGHERIAVINGPLRLDSARIRFAAWKDAMTESGVRPADELIGGDEAWTAESGAKAVRRLLESAPDLTAVFCANDLLAIGAVSALAERGLRVPDDISVIGFDDTVLARHTVPQLTTMKIHSRDMARSAARRLLERIERKDLPPVRIEFPIDLVERKSCKEVNTRKERR